MAINTKININLFTDLNYPISSINTQPTDGKHSACPSTATNTHNDDNIWYIYYSPRPPSTHKFKLRLTAQQQRTHHHPFARCLNCVYQAHRLHLFAHKNIIFEIILSNQSGLFVYSFSLWILCNVFRPVATGLGFTLYCWCWWVHGSHCWIFNPLWSAIDVDFMKFLFCFSRKSCAICFWLSQCNTFMVWVFSFIKGNTIKRMDCARFESFWNFD